MPNFFLAKKTLGKISPEFRNGNIQVGKNQFQSCDLGFASPYLLVTHDSEKAERTACNQW